MKRHTILGLAGLLLLPSLLITFSGSSSFAFREADATKSVNTQPESLQESDINRFTTAIEEIKNFYVQPISDNKLLEDAIRGMLSGLDPHSEYLDQNAYKTLLMATTGEFGGLGIEVTGEYGVLKVISPLDDTPAAKAGIKSGDYIVAINNKLVNEMTLDEAINQLRGKKGSMVNLTIIRKDQKNPIKLKLTRDEIHFASVKSNLLNQGFGYVRISQFQEPTPRLVTAAIESLKQKNGGPLKGLVLDLRNNPGGLLETAVKIVDIFLDNKSLNNKFDNVVVYTEGRLPSAKYVAKAKPGDILQSAPLVILVNTGSASASEIVAGALQDYHRAVIVGTTTFGKGSVQTILPLDKTHAIKLTTALYHTPSGKIIQNKGIIPDIVIENLKLDKNQKTDDAMLNPIHEFDLKGHLKGQESSNTNNLPPENQKDLTNLAESDFQLYEALKILTTMTMLNQNITIGTGTTANH